MKNQSKNTEVWIGVEHLEQDPHFLESMQKEFDHSPALASDDILNVGSSRRDFLKYLGFSIGAATLAAGCDIPVKKVIPYVVKPDEIVPGVASYYASSFVQGGDYCAVLVKTREGRPIKIEGNTLSSVTKGGTSARVQASVLSLYDTNRTQSPMKNDGGKWSKMTWADLDKEVAGKLSVGQVRIVTNTNLSPTAKKALDEFVAKYSGSKVVTYDPVSSSALLQANETCFGKKSVPNYKFDKASVIVSFGADFLGTWISPVEYARQYAENRRITDVSKASMSRHIQVEGGMTLTGSNADHRILVQPSEMGAAIATLYNAIAAKTSAASVAAPKVNDKAAAALTKLADQLLANVGKSLVVCGTNNTGEQTLVNAINNLLESYGNTMTFANASNQRQGVDADVQALVREMDGGQVGAVIVWGANPAFDLPKAVNFTEAFSKVKTKISLNGSPDETTALCDYIAPASHWLESWGDAEPKQGHFSLMQPTIAPLFDTRQAELSLLLWAGSPNINPAAEQPYYEYLNANWQASMFPRQNAYATFQAFWDSALHDGVFESPGKDIIEFGWGGDVNEAAAKVTKPGNGGLEISFFETVNVGAGQYADNPWLQEMPDPITRCVWGNYLAIPIEFDGDRRFDGVGPFKGLNSKESYKEADQIKITVNGQEQTVTCVRQFGQKTDTVSMALGYGRTVAGACGKNVGLNVYPWLNVDADGNTQYFASVENVSQKVGTDEYASVQYHHTMGVMGTANGYEGKVNVDELALMTIGRGYQGSLVDRSVIRRSNLSELGEFAQELHHERGNFEGLNQQTLYPYNEFVAEKYSQGHHWGLHIDLNSCVGCGACQVACLSENNVPVVGKHEVYRHHEMSWLRIDRYFFGDYENPNVVYQPMMCQHCDNAPCENVCPVSATNHSSEGLNQMAYNRCIGTRYCANNCPYKVRRFNWLDYTTADLFPANEVITTDKVPFYADNLTRMVLNPDVTVRVRGVMEKCSFCVQRIQEGKLTAKREGRALRDGDIKSACQTACPTGAITFGDTNDENSEIARRYKDELNYIVLEEVNTRPSVQYTSRVTNRDEALS
ncbi:MAG: TAT-variant-translocated molybdopterin oxidoreductase [Bacteroidetes bacterium]|nr:TAT-variant-translocated molybdopterin oxidoreductase [Bacteroidota bacterium]